MTNQIETSYDQDFFDYTSQISQVSASFVVPAVQKLLPNVKSVVDFGSARGVWLKQWNELGIKDYIGLDGDYVDVTRLHIPRENFIQSNLDGPVDLQRKFDLVYSLEVAEHLKPENSEQFVQSLCRHGDVVLFSAAPPGQGGESHINERPYQYWRDLFAKQGYDAFDCLRPKIAGQNDISYWYRYNCFLYVHKNAVHHLSQQIQSTRIKEHQEMADIAPLVFKIRKLIIRCLPQSLQNALARLKARL